MAAGIWSHLDWSRWLHDGTWVGGRRAPGAPIHGDARLISAHGELKRRSESWQEGKRPSGGTLVVGEIGKGVRLLDSVHACILAESGEGKSRRVAILSAMANFEQGRSLVINDIKGELRAFLEPMFEKAGTHRIVDVMFDAPASSIRFESARKGEGVFSGGGCRRLREGIARTRALCRARAVERPADSSTTALGTSSSASPSPSSRAHPSGRREDHHVRRGRDLAIGRPGPA